jgi:hypothetical protein
VTDRTPAVYFFRRSLELRAGVAQYVFYAVTPIEGEKPDPVPVIAGFPENWRPIGELGMCLFELGRPAGIYETVAERSQLRHATRISEAEALELYPALLEQQ